MDKLDVRKVDVLGKRSDDEENLIFIISNVSFNLLHPTVVVVILARSECIVFGSRISLGQGSASLGMILTLKRLSSNMVLISCDVEVIKHL